MQEQTTILAGCVMPHPPVIVPGVARGPMKATQTVAAMHQLAAEMAALQAETVVVITPHAPLFSDYLFVYDASPLNGNLSAFGVPEARLSLELDQPLLDHFVQRCSSIGVNAGSLNAGQLRRFDMDGNLDHGALVPLFFLQQTFSFRVLVVASAALPMPVLYAVGEQLRMAASELGRRIIVVASGDQSHKVNVDSPYGISPEGAEYDNQLVAALNRSDRTAILSIDAATRQKAAECGYRSIVMLCGAFSDRAIHSSVLSYEAPYGIGYCVAGIRPDPTGEKPAIDPMQAIETRQQTPQKQQSESASVPVQIARTVLVKKLRRSQDIDQSWLESLLEREPWLREKAGVFVSLKKQGDLRGCIGTTEPTTENIAAEIMQNAVSAATRDPRFEPVTADELPQLSISVDVLGTPVPVASLQELDPAVYGVIVRSGYRTGLLLPDLAGVDSVDEQLAIARRKAGIRAEESCSIERFRVTRYT